MKYIKTFKNHSDYQDFINKGGGGNPNTSIHYIIDSDLGILKDYNGHGKQKAGDVAYWNGSCVKTMDFNKYTSAFGPAVGVVVIPEGFAPDGKARIASLYGVDENGNQSSSNINMVWDQSMDVDTSLVNYTRVPITDNAGSTSTGSNSIGYLPSDKFTGTQSFVDYEVYYFIDNYTPFIPSPYLGDRPNPEYYKILEGGNALSDFNGLSNTETLVGLSLDYVAANAAWKYKDGASNLQWYLPAMGELGYLMVRFNEINNTITTLGGLALHRGHDFWSSSECIDNKIYTMFTASGDIYPYGKTNNSYMRPFAII